MSNFTFNEKAHYYELDGKRMYGVTTILGVIAKPALIGWAANMAVDHVIENSASEKTDDGLRYQVIESVLADARKAHTKKKEAAGTKGTDTHALVEEYVKSCIEIGHLAVLTDEQDKSDALVKFAGWALENNVKFLASEKRVYSEEYWTAGTADFTCEIDGKRYVGDLKTMKKIWDRTPFYQVAAYRKMLQEMGEPEYHGTLIVNINKETNELTEERSYDTEGDQKCFEAALCLYKNLNQ